MKPFIVFEGTDGSGTTSQSKELVNRLNELGIKAKWTCEPTRSFLGKFIRDIFEGRQVESLPKWRTMSLLFQADRELHVSQIQEDRKDSWVVCDRYWLSSYIYQSLSAEQEEPNKRLKLAAKKQAQDYILELNKHVLQPDLVMVLDVTADVALKRTSLFKQDEDFYEKAEMRRATAEAYKNYFGLFEEKVVHVDADNPTAFVSFAISAEIEKIYGIRC